MVFFNCNACGEAVKKNQVEKHYRTQCRNCEVLSCVDCGKEFWGDDYAQHTKCITEDEKYGGKSFKPKPNANKGEQKQELWVQQVQDAISKLKANPKLKNLLERLIDYPNIPRKQAKFENFLRNSLRVMDGSLAAQAWNAISAELNSTALTAQNVNRIEKEKDVKHTVTSGNVVAVGDNTSKNITVGDETSEEEDSIKDVETENGEKKKCKKKKEHETEKRVQERSEIENGKKKKLSKKKQEERPEEDQANSVEVGNGEKKECKKRKRGTETEKPETEDLCPRDGSPKKTKKNKTNNENLELPKRKKRKTEIDAEEDAKQNSSNETEDKTTKLSEGKEEVENAAGKFSWEAAIIGVLKRADGKELAVKKLRKKVLGEFHARGGDGKSYKEEQLLSKFTKKISHNPRLKVLKDVVRLVG